MSVADELTKTRQYLADAYAKVGEKGGTLPSQKNMANLADAIDSISGGGTPRPPLPVYPYPIDYFDGGEYGAIAYLRDGEVYYYTAKSANELKINASSDAASASPWTVVTLEDGFAVTNTIVLAWAMGTQGTIPDYTFSRSDLLQAVFLNENAPITTLGSYFCYRCSQLNCPITLPKTLTTIKSYFLSSCYKFNYPIEFPEGVTQIGTDFLFASSSFNHPIKIPSGVKTVNDNFLRSASAFNSTVTIPDTVTTIGIYFLASCPLYNQPLALPSSITQIQYDFLANCTSFNQPLALPAGLTSLGQGFLHSCSSFNQPLYIIDTVTNLRGQFLYGCKSFNQPLHLPDKLTATGASFMAECSAYNRPLDLPQGVINTGSAFMQNANAFVGPLNVHNITSAPTDGYSFTTTKADAPMYVTGVTIVGESAQAWKDALPDRDSSPYRKLIVAES